MRIVTMSDSHGNHSSLDRIVGRHPEAESFIFLGDGDGDIRRVMEAYPQRRFYSVCGNCDYGSRAPAHGLLEMAGRRIFYTHGHTYHAKLGLGKLLYAAECRQADLVLYGHTHFPVAECLDGLYVVNPGSCSGRDRPATYALVDITDAGIAAHIVELKRDRPVGASL